MFPEVSASEKETVCWELGKEDGKGGEKSRAKSLYGL